MTKKNKKKKELHGYYIDGTGKSYEMYVDEDSNITQKLMKDDEKNNNTDVADDTC